MQRRRHQASGGGWDRRFGLAWCRWLLERWIVSWGPISRAKMTKNPLVGCVDRYRISTYRRAREEKRKRRRRYTYPRIHAKVHLEWMENGREEGPTLPPARLSLPTGDLMRWGWIGFAVFLHTCSTSMRLHHCDAIHAADCSFLSLRWDEFLLIRSRGSLCTIVEDLLRLEFSATLQLHTPTHHVLFSHCVH